MRAHIWIIGFFVIFALQTLANPAPEVQAQETMSAKEVDPEPAPEAAAEKKECTCKQKSNSAESMNSEPAANAEAPVSDAKPQVRTPIQRIDRTSNVNPTKPVLTKPTLRDYRDTN